MENPSSKEVCVPDTPLEEDCGMLREEEASYGLRYRLPAVYGVFLMNFKEDGLESKFRTDTVVSDREQRSCGEPEFPSDLSPVSLFYEGTGRMFYFIR